MLGKHGGQEDVSKITSETSPVYVFPREDVSQKMEISDEQAWVGAVKYGSLHL